MICVGLGNAFKLLSGFSDTELPKNVKELVEAPLANCVLKGSLPQALTVNCFVRSSFACFAEKKRMPNMQPT